MSVVIAILASIIGQNYLTKPANFSFTYSVCRIRDIVVLTGLTSTIYQLDFSSVVTNIIYASSLISIRVSVISAERTGSINKLNLIR